jgi:hypothetical protein
MYMNTDPRLLFSFSMWLIFLASFESIYIEEKNTVDVAAYIKGGYNN